MIITRTPFRVSLFGGSTDYPAWFEEHGGAVLTTTIDKYCYISCRFVPPIFEHKSRIIYSQMEYVQDNKNIGHPAVRECLKYLGIERGVEIYHDKDLPSKRGLGASSVFTVGLLNALYNLLGTKPTRDQLARDAIYIEQELIGEAVGCQDQYASAFGGFMLIEFKGKDNTNILYPICTERIQKLEQYLMLFDTGTYRLAPRIAQTILSEMPNKKYELTRMKELVYEAKKILCEGDLIDFGKLLDTNWMLKKNLSKEVTTPFINDVYERALKAGALGGKLLGAGGGGFMLLFVEPDKQATVEEALGGLMHVPFHFEKLGSKVLYASD